MKQLLLLVILSFSFCLAPAQTPVALTNEFIIGADLSMTKAILDNDGVYKVDEQAIDVYEAFKYRKYTYGRVRLFHTPDGNESNGTVNSLDYTIQLAKDIKASGMKLLLDFHYSDTWADPSQQTKPKAWKDLNFARLNDSLYNYTKNVLNRFADEGIYPDMVQTGNEIHHGMLWDDGAIWVDGQPNWENFTTLLKSAIGGVRASEGGQNVPIMVHGFSSDDKNQCEEYMNKLNQYNVDFDIMGISYYVCWNGAMDKLDNTLEFLNHLYNKEIIVVETAYNWDGVPADYCVIDENQLPFPFTEQGQYDYLQALYALTSKYEDVKGIFYWGGDYIWAGDIGGSWSSLFHWEGNAMKAFDAFFDLLPVEEGPNTNNKPYTVFRNASGNIIVNSPDNKPDILDITIYDLTGRKIYQEHTSEFPIDIHLNPAFTSACIVTITNERGLVYNFKVF